ncbi:MAG: protein kinase [Alphaproteobacteria bacterium]|nr:protein kinase [Alphaproteobacteria bacterium]
MTPQGQQFHILSCIGKGGFGEVYRARKVGDGGFRKDVALKVLNTNMAQVDDVARRLKDEARILGLLNHRAIVKVDLLAQLEGRWTVVMEFVEGADLKEILKANGRLPLGAALEVCQEVASALDYAYNHKVDDPEHPERGRRPLHLLHRDIKPSNIQLTAHGDVKVLDFGIARAEFDSREAVTRTNMFLTKEYAAPERLSGKEHPGGDVFSLGAVLYELITGGRLNLLGPAVEALMRGERGFSLASYQQTRMAGVREALAQVDGVNDALVELIVRTLAWSPEPRPSAREFKNALRRLVRELGEGESLGEWAERVVSPLVEVKRAAMAASPAGESGAPGGELAGRTVVTDGRTFNLVPAETQIDRTTLLDLDEPSSAWSIEQSRLSGEVLPPTEAVGRAVPEPTLREVPQEAPPVVVPGRRWPVFALVGTMLLLGACAGFGGLVWWGLPSAPMADAVTEEVSPPDPGAVEPEPSAQPVAEPRMENTEGSSSPPEEQIKRPSAPKTGAPVAKENGAAPAPHTTPEPSTSSSPWDTPVTEPEPKKVVVRPRPAAASTGRVSVSGDAKAIVLQGDGGRFEFGAPGQSVPVGEYELRARWADGTLSRSQGVFTVAPSGVFSINCTSWNFTCLKK